MLVQFYTRESGLESGSTFVRQESIEGEEK